MQYGIKLYTWNKGILPFSWKEYNNLKAFKLKSHSQMRDTNTC